MRRLSLTKQETQQHSCGVSKFSQPLADSFEGCFTQSYRWNIGYENAKNLVIELLVEGKQTTPEILAHCVPAIDQSRWLFSRSPP